MKTDMNLYRTDRLLDPLKNRSQRHLRPQRDGDPAGTVSFI